MGRQPDSYVDLMGESWDLTQLDEEETSLLADLQQRAKADPDWNGFENYWTKAVASLYDGRGLPRTELVRKPLYKIAQDLGGRIAIAAGYARHPDYRDDLRAIIRTHYRTRREFCEATGIAEDMLSHVLSGRKHLAIDTLATALGRIGYRVRLHAEPVAATNQAG